MREFVSKKMQKCHGMLYVLLLLLKALEPWPTRAQHAVDVVRAQQGGDHDEQLEGHEYEADGPARAKQILLVQVVLMLTSGQDRHGKATQVVRAVEGGVLISTALQLLIFLTRTK